MANGTGPYGDGAYGQGDPGHPQGPTQPGVNGWQQAPAQGPGPGASGGDWGNQAPGAGAWPQQQPAGAWQQQPQAPQQPVSPWGQPDRIPQQPQGYAQQPPQGYAPQQPQGYAPQPQAPQGYQQPQGYAQPQAPQQYPTQDARPQAPGMTPNPFALPGQNAYAGYQSAPQGQPVNPYAGTPLGTNAAAQRDDQTWLQRAGLSKGRAVWLGVLLVAAGGFFVYDKFFSNDPGTAKVGDCITANAAGFDVKKVSCTDPSAVGKVTAKYSGSDESKCYGALGSGGSLVHIYGKNPAILCLERIDGSGDLNTSPTVSG